MKDFTGREISIGDFVVFVAKSSQWSSELCFHRSSELCFGKVHHMTLKGCSVRTNRWGGMTLNKGQYTALTKTSKCVLIPPESIPPEIMTVLCQEDK